MSSSTGPGEGSKAPGAGEERCAEPRRPDRERFQEEVARELGVDLSRPGPTSPDEGGRPKRRRRRAR